VAVGWCSISRQEDAYSSSSEKILLFLFLEVKISSYVIKHYACYSNKDFVKGHYGVA
jgi:hypothetical protein